MNKTVKYARNLRQNQSEAEKLMWSKLRDRRFHGLKFRRQHPIPPYIVDFFCEKHELVIELDGGQHSPEVDAKRQVYIEARGFRVIRFWNNDVLSNIEGILEVLRGYTPSPTAASVFEGKTQLRCPLPVGESEYEERL